MDIFRFINSADIRSHLREIQYQFTATQAAWLVWQSKDTSMDERHQAWREIIETMPDCAIEERHNTVPQESLHEYLRTLMALEDTLIHRFFSDDADAVYLYRYFKKDDPRWSEDFDRVFPTFAECLKTIHEYSDADIACIEVKKRWFASAKVSMEIEMRSGDRIHSIHCTGLMKDEHDILFYGFEGMWFDFPTPFEKGDILQSCRENEYPGEYLGGGPFVMSDISSISRNSECQRWSGDYTDMNAWGYYQNSESGEIYSDCMHCYMDLEYYRGELSGNRRVLKALKNYIKDEIDVCLYSRAYHVILTETHAKNIRPLEYAHEGMVLAGLEE